MSPAHVKTLLDGALSRKKSIASAYLEFEPLPFITVKEAMAQRYSFSYGSVSLRSTVSAFEKVMKFGKTTVLVLYEHEKFYPDRTRDDTSRDVWMNDTHCLLLGAEGKMALKEIKSGIVYGIKDGKVTKSL